MNVQGKIINEYSSAPTRSPSTPSGPTGGSSSSPSLDENAGSSPSRQSVPVFWPEKERQLLHEDFLAGIGLELAQEYVREERYRQHEEFMERIANELAQEEDVVVSAESLN